MSEKIDTAMLFQIEKRPVGNPSWKKGGASPNVLGRPKGSTPQTKLLKRMLADADGIVDAICARALDGDIGAASLIISRLIPAIKAQSEKVYFDLRSDAPISAQISQVLEAVAAGAVAPDTAKVVIDSIKALGEVRATEELEARIAALEERQL